MHRLLTSLVLLFVAASVHASGFQLSPQIIAVANREHSQELTLQLLPSPNTAGAETSISFNLDAFGWVQVLPPAPAAGLQVHCTLVGGVARATLMTTSGGALPTTNSIPACRFRVRPHSKTPRGNYTVLQSGGFAVSTDGSVIPIASSSLRVIVD